MLDPVSLLNKYGHSEDQFKATGLQWEDLVKIYDDYVSIRQGLMPTADNIAACLRQVEAVHSLRIRIKDPEHLVEKIIRKKIEDPSSDINIGNYRSVITDLIGVRALHLFKEDWSLIHDFIVNKWKLHETPIAYVRAGDHPDWSSRFKEKGCDIRLHKAGYRSVHYLAESMPTKELHIVEIQVRTIFEEAWSEIDHGIQYPYGADPILVQYLDTFNRLAGSADEMGSFVRNLKTALDEQTHKQCALAAERDKIFDELQDLVGKLQIEKKEKEKLEAKLAKLETAARASAQVVQPPVPLAGTSPLTLQFTSEKPLWGAGTSTGNKCSKCGRDLSTWALGGICDTCRSTTLISDTFHVGGSPYGKCSKCGRDLGVLWPADGICDICKATALPSGTFHVGGSP